ncbi:MAG: molybdopterin-dependent oxidoreductase, partial [Firmicutes bacterium]|nr:molybdopterin-dependent oxidoreductase [Bacillota bacterium]
LEKLDFLVVSDIMENETDELAHVVLPEASFAEKDGTFTNTERRVQRVRKAVEPPGAARADWEILCLVARALGYPMDYTSPADIMEEIRRLTPSYAGITYGRLERGGLHWPCPAKDHPGTPVLHVGKFARGLGKFHPVDHIPPEETPDEEYPLVLSTGRRLLHYHTGTMTLRTGTLEVRYPEEYLEVNPADAARLGIESGDLVRVASRRGLVEVRARVTEVVPPGMVFTSFHFPAVAINRLTNPARDPVAKIPEYKVCAVRVEKVSPAAV